MGTIVLHNGVFKASQFPICAYIKSTKTTTFCCTTEKVNNRREVLKKVDKELKNGDERAALALVKDLQNNGGLNCFGAARQVPQRLYTLDELKLNGIKTAALLSPVDTTLGSIERNLQFAAILGGLAVWNALDLTPQQIFYSSLGLLFLGTLDAISFRGGISGLILDTAGHILSAKYHNRVLQHEAGHFLIAYMLGVLPKGYSLTSWEALRKEGSLNVQAGTAFVDFEFTKELDQLFQSLGFTQQKADSQVRWAVLNTALILRRHENARSKLAGAMSEGQSVGGCIAIIEETIRDTEL